MRRDDEPAPDDYAAIRRRLLERGYLQGPIERFLLRDALATRRGLPRLLAAALRGAALGGPLLGALLAAAVAAANRPLQGASDLLLLWVYLTLPAVLVLLLLDLAAAAVVAALARRRGARPGDTLRASLLVGLPTLIYLLAIARVRRPASGLVEETLFIGLVLGITLLLARLAGLVSLAGVITREGGLPRRQRRPFVALIVLLLPIAALFVGAGRLLGPSEVSDVPSSFAIREADGVLLVGVDGLDGSMIQAFEPRGAVSDLLELMESGAVFPLQREGGAEPAQVWTTLMTGVDASRHGVRGAGTERLPGVATPLDRAAGPLGLGAALRFLLPARTVPTTGAVRRTRTLWEILALKVPAMAVGWWASWPAVDPGAPVQLGYVVTDRVLPKLLSGADGDRDTAPESLFARLEGEFAGDREAIAADFERSFVGVQTERARRLARESHLIDAYALRTTRRLGGDDSVRAAFVYLPGLEILHHRLEPETDSVAGWVEAQAVFEAYLAWLGREIGTLRIARAGWQVILVADPGRRDGPPAEGFVVVDGPAGRPGCVGPSIDELDVTPLVLGLAGFPSSREMGGQAPGACLDSGSWSQRVGTFGKRGPFRDVDRSEYDPEMVERLRSLGYLN